MALKEPLMIATFEQENEIELRAGIGESLLIKDIRVFGGGDFILAYIDKTTVGCFVNHSPTWSHIGYTYENDFGGVSLLQFLHKRGIFKGYPIGEGQTFLLKSSDSSKMGYVTIFYEVYDAGDQTPDKPNGTESDEYFYINYGTVAEPVLGGDSLVDKTLIPVEFPAFPFHATVPPKSEITVHGIAFSARSYSENSGQDKVRTTYLKLIKEREVLFDRGKKGFRMLGYNSVSDGLSVGSQYSDFGYMIYKDKKEPLIFEKPLVFEAGEELNVYISTEVLSGSPNPPETFWETAFIQTVRRVR